MQQHYHYGTESKQTGPDEITHYTVTYEWDKEKEIPVRTLIPFVTRTLAEEKLAREGKLYD